MACIDYYPWMICYDRKNAIENIGKSKHNFIIVFDIDCIVKPPVIHICEDHKRTCHYFLELVDAIHYTARHDIKEVYTYHVDTFSDPNFINITALFEHPIVFIANLELSYRIHNHMDSMSAFKEAYGVWSLFRSEYKNVIDQLIEKYPAYKTILSDYCMQYDLLENDVFVNTDDFVSKIIIDHV